MSIWHWFRKQKPNYQYVPKSHGLVVSKPDKRDYLVKVTAPIIQTVPDQHVIPMPPIRNQGNIGSCFAFAGIACVESILQNRYPNKYIELSELYTYYHVRNDINHTYPIDGGASIRDTVQSLLDKGVCPELAFPYSDASAAVVAPMVSEWFAHFYKITSYARVTNLDDLMRMISEGIPVVCGIWVKNDFYSLNVKQYQYFATGKTNVGGHAVVVYGYDKDKRVLALRNSWGTLWGNQGNFLMDFDTFEANSFDWFVVNINGENKWIVPPKP